MVTCLISVVKGRPYSDTFFRSTQGIGVVVVKSERRLDIPGLLWLLFILHSLTGGLLLLQAFPAAAIPTGGRAAAMSWQGRRRAAAGRGGAARGRGGQEVQTVSGLPHWGAYNKARKKRSRSGLKAAVK